MSVKIIVDSTCDFEPEERQALGIEMIPLTVQFGEEIFRDGIDITKEEFFQRLRASKELPHTSQINPATFLEVYERLGADGSELLVMTISKNLSGTYNIRSHRCHGHRNTGTFQTLQNPAQSAPAAPLSKLSA